MNFADIIKKQKDFFYIGKTKDVDFRIDMLRRLKDSVKSHEQEILEALKKDLNKAPFESMATEVGIVYEEINYLIKNVKSLSRAKRVATPIYNWPSRSYIYQEPYGIVLVMGPFNYPFQLNIVPLAGAIAAGNCVVLKPSRSSKETAKVIMKIIEQCFAEEYVAVVEPFGGRQEVTALLKERFDYIFFTGSVSVGKVVMEAAARNLTPVTLELGGKSPVIIDKNCHVALAAKRVAWGKFINAAQTCVAPDYVLIHKDIKEEFLQKVSYYVEQFYGSDPKKSPDYPRIIDENQFDRLVGYLSEGRILFGGGSQRESLYIAPTVIDEVDLNSPVMTDEIFGPILPLVEYENIEEAINFVNQREKPLALYVFTRDNKLAHKILNETSAGGSCINDTIMHAASGTLPFGGVGNSGMGSYHGKYTFQCFSHARAVVKRGNILDPGFRYAPYKDKLKLLRYIFR